MFKKILIANRGEIAGRIIRTCKRLGIHTVAVYSDADRTALHTRLADEALHIGPARAAESYLNMDRIITAAQTSGAEAIHPGYGFLSENADFVRRCNAADLTFIGPDAETIDRMGSKRAAKTIMEEAGVPVVPGYYGDDQSVANLHAQAQRIGWPLMIKAVAGGGGKGMRVVHAEHEFKDALEGAKREASAGFGNDEVLLERYVERPRHIEFQIFGDRQGHKLHIFERECTLQRRFQKVLEETPSPFLDKTLREQMGEAAVAAAKAVDYVNAGTIEFIVGADGAFYFMEMNTRLQVEHPVTEAITGLDLVEWQLRIAAGEHLPTDQAGIARHGHAIEVRLYAENVERGFLPAIGRITAFQHPPEDTHFRVDTGVEPGDEISIHYDPMIAKLTVWDATRDAAITRLHRTLARTAVFGLTTNLALLHSIAGDAVFATGNFDTGFIDNRLATLLHGTEASTTSLAAATAGSLATLASETSKSEDAFSPWRRRDGWRANTDSGFSIIWRDAADKDHRLSVRGGAHHFTLHGPDRVHHVTARYDSDTTLSLELNGERHRFFVVHHARLYQIANRGQRIILEWIDPLAGSAAQNTGENRPVSPMPGRIVAVHVREGETVELGQALLVLEGMKMEYTLKAPKAGTIEKLLHKKDDNVDAETPLVEIR